LIDEVLGVGVGIEECFGGEEWYRVVNGDADDESFLKHLLSYEQRFSGDFV